jgi:hypothetical protein
MPKESRLRIAKRRRVMVKDADLTSTFYALAKIQSDIERKKAQNRMWVETHMPIVAMLFDQLVKAKMSSKMVKLEKF